MRSCFHQYLWPFSQTPTHSHINLEQVAEQGQQYFEWKPTPTCRSSRLQGEWVLHVCSYQPELNKILGRRDQNVVRPANERKVIAEYMSSLFLDCAWVHSVQGSGVQRMVMPGETAWLYTPYQHRRIQDFFRGGLKDKFIRMCTAGPWEPPPAPPGRGGPQPYLGAPPQLQYFYCFTFLILKIIIYISMIKCHEQLAGTGGGNQLNHPRHFVLYQGLL